MVTQKLKYSERFILVGVQLNKIAIITIYLVPETSDVSRGQIEKEIGKSLRCDWLLSVEKVTVLDAIGF